VHKRLVSRDVSLRQGRLIEPGYGRIRKLPVYLSGSALHSDEWETGAYAMPALFDFWKKNPRLRCATVSGKTGFLGSIHPLPDGKAAWRSVSDEGMLLRAAILGR